MELDCRVVLWLIFGVMLGDGEVFFVSEFCGDDEF